MNIGFLRARLHVLGFSFNFVNRPLYEKLATVLTEDNSIIAILEGTDQSTGRWTSFVIADDQVFILSSDSEEGVDIAIHKRSEVTIVEIDEKGDSFSIITIKTPLHFYSLKKVETSQALIFSGALK